MANLLWTIDRFESDRAVVEPATGDTLEVPRAFLPARSREADVLRVSAEPGSDTAAWLLALDREETRRRRAQAQRERDALGRRDPGGDVTL